MKLFPRLVLFHPWEPFVLNVVLPCLLDVRMVLDSFGVGDGFRVIRAVAPFRVGNFSVDFGAEFRQESTNGSVWLGRSKTGSFGEGLPTLASAGRFKI